MAKNLPPGPPPTGNPLAQLRLMSDLRRDLIGKLAELHTVYGDFYHVAGMNQFVTSNPQVIQQVTVTQAAKFHKDSDYTNPHTGLARFLGSGLLTSNGEFWRRQRRLAAPAFHTRRIAAYSQAMVGCTLDMLRHWSDRGWLDVSAEMMRLTLLIVARTLFNADVADEVERVGRAMEAIQDYASQMIRLPAWIPTPAELRARRAQQDLDAIIYRIIGERRAESADRGDLISMLLLAEDEEGSRMTDRQVRDEVVTLFLAGHETTANTLSWTWYLLAQHPVIEARLHAELDTVLAGRAPALEDLAHLPYTEMVIKEALRLYPPAYAFSRVAVEDVTLLDYTMPKDSVIVVLSYFTHRDPRWWDEPESFRPERFSAECEQHIPKYAYIPFGAGARICIGSSFAMMEARLILATIASRFRLRLEPGQRVEMLPRITLNPKNGIRVMLEQRQPAPAVAADPV